MTDNARSSQEIERELEQERAQLNVTIDEFFNRLTFEDAWNRVGAYMRENRQEFGQTLGRAVKEKPLAVALTAVGLTWLLFGPSSRPPDRRDARSRASGYGSPSGSETWPPPANSDVDTGRTAGSASAAESLPRASEVSGDQRAGPRP